MKYRRVQQSYRYQQINNIIPDVLAAIELPPQCHSWDDFFDFSRMSVSSITEDVNGIAIAIHRMKHNIWSRFKGNYIRIWLLTLMTVGFLQNYRLILSTIAIFGVWSAICLLTIISVADHRFSNTAKKNLRRYNLTLGERSTISIAMSHLVLYFQGTLQQTYAITLVVGILVFLHSVSRPLTVELGRKNTPKVVASHGFLDTDSDEGEETLVFSPSSPCSSKDMNITQVKEMPKASPGIIRRIRDAPSGVVDTSTCIRRHVAKANVAVPYAVEDKLK